jgi:type VI secretion system Hcp family effector
MSTPAYIAITGKTQGNITQGAFTADSVGNIYQEGHEDQILVQEIKHRVTTPTDPQSGQPSGQRVHKPFVFTCDLNKAIPLLYQALANGSAPRSRASRSTSSPPSSKTPSSSISTPCCPTPRTAASPATPN